MERHDYWTRYWQRRFSRRGLIGGAVVGGVGLSGLALVGCGGDDQGKPKTGDTPIATVAPAVKRGGKLSIGFTQDATTLDPHVGVSGFDANYLHAIYDSLVGYDTEFKSDPNRSLALTVGVPDPLTLVFNLRDASFHDGTPVDSSAIKFNIERILAPATNAQNRVQFLSIDQIVAQDPKTLIFKLKSPDAAIIAALGSRGSLIVSPAAISKYGAQFGSNPVGSGPYIFKSRVTGSSVSLERNPKYWAKDSAGNQLPYFDTIDMKFIQDGTARAAAMRAGDVQFVEPAAKDIATFRKDDSYRVVELKGGRPGHTLQYNRAIPPMDDQNLRLAIAWAEDAQAIVDGAFFGEASIAKGGFWPPQTWVYQDTPNHPLLDINKAKAFLAKSKYAGETIKLTAFTVPEQVQAVQILQDNLKKLGVVSAIETGDIGPIAANFFGKQSAHIFSSSFGLYPEPNHISSNVFSGGGSQNAGALSGVKQDQDIEDLITKGRTTYDLAQRKKIYNDLYQLVVDRAQPAIVMVYQKVAVVGNSKLQNLELSVMADGWYRFHELWSKA